MKVSKGTLRVLTKLNDKELLNMAKLIPFGTSPSSLFNTGFGEFYNMLDDFFTDIKPYKSSLRDTFRLDVKENENDFSVVADLPGIKKEEISISVDEGRLSIAVNRNEESEDSKDNYLHKERRSCSMTRSIYLGENTDSGSIKAKLEEGVLTVTIPKKAKIDTRVNVEIE